MQGLLISYLPRNIGGIWSPGGDIQAPPLRAAPSGLTEFQFFFQPLYTVMAPMYWFVGDSWSSPFGSLYDGVEDEDWIHPLADNAVPGLYNPGLLPAYAHDIPNDWQTLVGLGSDPIAAEKAAARLAQARWAEFYEIIDDVSSLTFLCIDGFVWQVFAKDETLLDTVAADLETSAGFRVSRTKALGENAR